MISFSTALILLLLVGLFGLALGYILRFLQMTIAKAQLEVNVRKTLNKARLKAANIVAEAHEQTASQRQDLDMRLKEIKDLEMAFITREEKIADNEAQIEQTRTDLNQITVSYQKKLMQLAAEELISIDQLKSELIKEIDLQLEDYYQARLNDLNTKYDKQLENVIAETLPEVTRRTVRNNTSVTINVSPDEIGKVIGREGSNIKAFERYAGVDLLIDDSANTVTISSFNPKRRLIAKQALVELLEDGRVNRDAIHHMLDKVEQDLNKEGTKLLETGLASLELINENLLSDNVKQSLQNLYYRHSYGQNQLEHALEVADIAGRMATSLLPDKVSEATMAGLLHDIGKSISDSSDHIQEGLKILSEDEYDFPADVITAISEHHDEASSDIISAIVKAADTLSSARPGARVQSTATYLSRLEKLEKFIAGRDTVDNVYAVSGGREVYIFVRNHNHTTNSLRQLAVSIAADLKQQGLVHAPIKLHVIREDEIIENVA